jgi:hypothetical protein
MRSIRPASARAVFVLAIVLATLASACNGDPPAFTAEKDAADPIRLPGAGTSTPRPSSPGTAPTGTAKGIAGELTSGPFTLDRSVWFSGFKITLTKGTVDVQKKTLTVEGEGENEGPTDDSLYEDVTLEQDSLGIADGSIRTNTTVLAGSRNAVTVEINQLPANFDLAKAVLVFGGAKQHQARMPLKGGAGAVTAEPLTVASPPPIRAGGLLLTIDKLSVRGDEPKRHSQAPSESIFVVMEGSVRFDASSTNFQSQNLSMFPPKGAPQSANHLNALPREGSSEKIFVVFEMPTPIGGEYTLQIKGNFVYTDMRFSPKGPVTVDTKFNLPAYP